MQGLRGIIEDFKEYGRKEHLFSTSVSALEIYYKLKWLEKEIKDDWIKRESQTGPGDSYTIGYVEACENILGSEVEK